MKQIYLLATLFIAGFAYGQNFVIHDYNTGAPMTSPIVLTVDSASTVDYADSKFYIVNTTGGDLACSWSRKRRAHDPSIVIDQICDDELCFDANDATLYSRPSTGFSIPAGDSSIFQPKVWPGDVPACVIYTYYIYSGLGSLQDSIEIKFRFDAQDCFLTNEEQEIDFSTYPNPASSDFNIQMTTNGADVDLMVYNILGETVMNEQMFDGLNNVNIESLNNGVYFYSILKNGKAVETKKLIVRK